MTDVAVVGGTLIDGTGAPPTRSAVLVRGDRIEAVTDGSDRPAAERIVDVGGLTVLPGLIDAHSHLGLVGPVNDVAAALTAARIFRNAALALDAGFTTVRDVGGIDGGVASAVAAGLVPGPRILPSGPIICRTGGHGDTTPAFCVAPDPAASGLPGLTRQAQPVDGADEMRRVVRATLQRGATQIKVAVTEGFADHDADRSPVELTIEELMAAVAEADAVGTYVTAHAHHSHGIRHGLAAGVSCFEHGTFLDQDTADAMASAGAALVPTLAVVRLIREVAGVAADIVARSELFERSMAESLKIARDAGVVVGSGSDITGVEQSRRGLEVTLRAGVVGGLEAVTMATANNARILRRPDLGSVRPGMLADVIAVEGDPLYEPEVFDDPARVRLVVQGGRIVKNTCDRP